MKVIPVCLCSLAAEKSQLQTNIASSKLFLSLTSSTTTLTLRLKDLALRFFIT